MEAARSGDFPPSGSEGLLGGSAVLSRLLEVSRERKWREFLVERIVFVLGSHLRKPNASSSVRRPRAAESSSESLVVASATEGGVEFLAMPRVIFSTRFLYLDLTKGQIKAYFFFKAYFFLKIPLVYINLDV